MITTIQELILELDKIQTSFINNKLIEIIKISIITMFPKLNTYDIEILIKLTTYIIYIISLKFNFKNEKNYYDQWEQNNCRDIRGVVLLLLPFINDNDNSYLLTILTDLNHLLYSLPESNIKNEIINLKRNKILSTHFKFGNMGIGLLNQNNNNLLELYTDNEKLIYKIIHQNFISLLKTLEIMNGKYYINWINIVPLNLTNYKYNILYQSTREKIVEKNYNSDLINYKGLWLGDFYNVIRNKFYREIIPVKWLIFPFETSDTNKFYLINSLNKILSLNDILKIPVSDYNDLFDYQKIKFINILNNIINNTKSISFNVLRYCLVYFINNHIFDYDTTPQIFKIFKLSNEDEDTKDDDFIKKDDITIKKITNPNIRECLTYIRDNHINDFWNYLKLIMELFKSCAFGKFLIKNNQIIYNYAYDTLDDTFYDDKDKKVKDKKLKDINYTEINYKNIYNIAKSLSHKDLNNWELLPDNYLSLENPENFFIKIFNLSPDKWINLSGNLKRQFFYKTIIYDDEIKKIINKFQDIFIDLVFEELITNGLLNTFVTNLDITDKSRLPYKTSLMQDKKKENFKKNYEKNKDDWLNSYYYLTNTQFKEIDLIKVNKKNIINPLDKYELKNYFNIISTQAWTTYYAMDWLSQISFFKHYIYHQVLYVTGATGQGKSTQVPKLLLYALKVINYKSNGKIICTQPRIPPTVENATRIADELVVPIYESSNYTNNKIDTNNYYIQYRHQQNSHTSDNIIHSVLRIVTDGTLLTQLKNNIVMLKKIKNKFINETIYDIIIVDEAHEHNTNMDLILTLARQTCYLNNKIKLIIVSATMDSDEPIYRRFYKNINDMLMYPIKNIIIQHPILNKDFIINPQLMDRRYHISPPGETTQYRVNEIYLINKINEENDKNASLISQTNAYTAVLDICKKTTFGEILFFANGKKEIEDALEYLNTNMPPGNIALPYYSNLNNNYKEIISKIDTKITTIKNKRENIKNEWGETFIQDNSVPNNIYNRAVIIATNVAEASITITSLKFVIDNGFSKVNLFNPLINKTILQVEKISESSRVQRRGRVGRVGDGDVYYMYNKKTRELVAPKYKITQENISNLINLLGGKSLNTKNIKDIDNIKYLYISDADPNIYLSLSNYIINTDSYYYNSGLHDIYLKNYFINNNIIYYFDLQNNFKWKYLFETGQILNNVLDNKGEYYLIHPFEIKIDRNILNDIIYYNNKQINYIIDSEYNYLLLELSTQNRLLNMEYTKIDEIIYYTNTGNYFITELTAKINDLTSSISLSYNNALTLLAASAMDCEENIFELIIFLELISYSIKSIINTDLYTINKFNKLYKNNKIKSDIIFLYEIIKNFKNEFSDLKVFNINKIKNIIFAKCNEIYDIYRNNLISYKTELDVELWCQLYNLKNNNKNEKDYILKILYSKEILNIFELDIDKNKNKIIKWCNDQYLNSKIIFSFLEKLYTTYLGLLKPDTNNKIILHNIESIIWAKKFSSNFNKCLTDYTIDEKIIRSFMYGYPMQFAMINNNNLITILNNTFNIDSNIETLTNISHDLVFYLNYNKLDTSESLNIGLLSEIKPEWLLSSFPFIFNIINTIDMNKNLLLFLKMRLKNYMNKSYYVWNHNDVCILRDFYKVFN